MQSKGISRQAHRNAVIRGDVHSRRSGRPDSLYGDLLRGKSDLVFLRLLYDRINQFLVRLVRIRAAHHSNVVQIVLEGIIRQLRRNDLKARVNHSDDGQKPEERFYCSHVPQSCSAGDVEITSRRPAKHSLKIFDYRGNRNIAYFASLAENDFHSTFGNFLPYGDSKRDTDQIRVFELHARALIPVIEHHIKSRGFEALGNIL